MQKTHHHHPLKWITRQQHVLMSTSYFSFGCDISHCYQPFVRYVKLISPSKPYSDDTDNGTAFNLSCRVLIWRHSRKLYRVNNCKWAPRKYKFQYLGCHYCNYLLFWIRSDCRERPPCHYQYNLIYNSWLMKRKRSSRNIFLNIKQVEILITQHKEIDWQHFT